MTYDVYGIGNALVDIQSKVDDAFLKQVTSEHFPGVISKGAMHLVNTDFQAHLLTLLEGRDLHTVSGGSACNTMIGVAQMGLRVKYAGKVGDDIYGKFYAEDIHKVQVDFDVPYGTDATGTCVIAVTADAQRTMFTNLGMSIELTPEDIKEEDIKNSKWVYIEGYLWDAPGPKAASIKAMELAKKHGVQVAYTFSDAFCVNRARNDFHEFTKKYVDLVFCNEEEGFAFSETNNVDETLAHIQALGTNAALTRSELGSTIAWGNDRYKISPVIVDPVDTTGAGDLYASGVLAGLCRGNAPQVAGDLGARLASQVIAVYGARIPNEPVASVANGS